MSGTIRRAAVAITLATGVLVGGIGVQHALAQTSSPSATSSASASGSGSSSTAHSCPNMGSNSPGSSTSTSG